MSEGRAPETSAEAEVELTVSPEDTAARLGIDPGEVYPELEAWSQKQLLAFEKEALGFYVSGHPLDRYRGDLQRYASAITSDFAAGKRGVGDSSIGGIVSQYREMITKRGDKMAVGATWRSANETVPQPASLPPAATGGVPDANVLVDDYWDVYKVLLR